MNRKKLLLKNGLAGFLCQLLSQLIQFVIRIFMLQYIGVEIMGISSTFTSILQTLSLTELGFQTAVVYYLYQPLKEHDEIKINQIMMILKRVYEIVGIVFITIAMVCIPFLKYLLKNVDITSTIIGYYIIMSLNIAFSYFITYKRALLFADQKEYISKFVDCIFNIGISILKILVIIFLKNYTFFLILQIGQTLGANVVIQLFCKKEYKYLKKSKFNFSMFKSISRDVKNVFMGKLAGYAYGATDNLVISSLIGTIYVGYLSNYMVFISTIKQIIGSLFYSMTPIIGNMLIENNDDEINEINFRIYSYVRYIIATAIIVPWLILADDAIKILFGEKYILSYTIVILLAVDLYIHIVYTPCCEYISGSGFFSIDKRIAIIGAVINVVTSVCFVFKMGVEGVLVGTALSQMFFWIGRSYTVYFYVFKLGKIAYFRYIVKNIKWIFMLLLQIIILLYIRSKFIFDNYLLSTMFILILCEVMNILVNLICFHFSEEQTKLINLIKK